MAPCPRARDSQSHPGGTSPQTREFSRALPVSPGVMQEEDDSTSAPHHGGNPPCPPAPLKRLLSRAHPGSAIVLHSPKKGTLWLRSTRPKKGLSNLPKVTPLTSNSLEDPGRSVGPLSPPPLEGDPLCFFTPGLGGGRLGEARSFLMEPWQGNLGIWEENSHLGEGWVSPLLPEPPRPEGAPQQLPCL